MNAQQRKKARLVYLGAAEIIDKGGDAPYQTLSCLAVEKVAGYGGAAGWSIYAKEYAAIFRPVTTDVSAWGDLWGKRAKECRVLALLFMAEIIK